MKDILFYGIDGNAAIHFACRELQKAGYRITDRPGEDVTHLILPVPSFSSDGHIRGGGDLKMLLNTLAKDVTVIGGNLHDTPHALDLLQDEQYLAENAAITADCAMRIAGNNLSIRFEGCKTLIIGWGRIGKCLAQLLRSMGADVTVAARRQEHRASLISLGYHAVHPNELAELLHQFRVIFNTAPQMLLDKTKTALCRHDCVLIDLASVPGIEDENVIVARGLPGRDLPESSGALIAQAVIRLLKPKGGIQ